MKRLSQDQQEIVTIVIAAATGEATEEQLARISRHLAENGELRLFALQLLSQEAWLTWHGSRARTMEDRASLAAKIESDLNVVRKREVSRITAVRLALGDSFAHALSARYSQAKPVADRFVDGLKMRDARRLFVPVTCALLLLGIGAALGAWTAKWFGTDRQQFAAQPAPFAPSDGDHIVFLASYEARLMQDTACVWGSEMRRRPNGGDSLRSGDSLNLIQGLAELELSWPARGSATLRLEGPAGMVLMSDDGVSLNHGKLTANVELGYDRFVVETPLGRIEVTSDAKIGVAASPTAVEVHVFDGAAKVVTPWASDTLSSDTLDVHAEQSIRLTATDARTVDVLRGAAIPSYFTSQMSMSEDLLDISDEYVAAIKEASPVCYWRFNLPVDGMIHNEMSDRYHGRVLGKPEWVNERGNMTMQCGVWLAPDMSPSHVVSDRPLESVSLESYALELWVKPSHCHLGTIGTFLCPPGNDPAVHGMHGVLLELGGPWTTYTDLEHPGRVRFLHRDPPGWSGGTSCFSKSAYSLRKWQHFVALKDKSEMRLYINGEVVATAENQTPLPDGLELLVGQLDRERNSRPFIGQLDELAFYERALSDEEIQTHYRLVRPVLAPRDGI